MLSHGLPLNKLHMLDIPLSDHKAVIFQTQLPPPLPKPHSSILSRSLNSYLAQSFHQAFLAASPSASKQSNFFINELVSILMIPAWIFLALLHLFKKITWNGIPCLQCRKAERKWKKDELMD